MTPLVCSIHCTTHYNFKLHNIDRRFTDAQAVTYHSIPFYVGCIDNLVVGGMDALLFDDAISYVNVFSCA